jgi:RimJ/RimL family protein N-acetyltransferase
VIQTERMLLRRFTEADVDAFSGINAHPQVTRFLRDGAPYTREDTMELMASIDRHWDERGFGLWAAESRATGELLGFVGLAVPEFLPEVLPAVEVGWRLARARWGTGLATEGGEASLRYGFDVLGCDRIVSIRQPANTASGRVMQKLGMRPVIETAHPIYGYRLTVHEILAEQWRTHSP